jgi:hypothetical protein
MEGGQVTKILGCLIFVAIILLSAARSISGVGVMVNWGAFTNPILDENGTALPENCLVQLVWDADLDGLDEPGEGGAPSNGDRLLDTSRIGAGSFFPGRFSANTSVEGVGAGERLYVRAWNAEEVKDATHYGDTRVTDSAMWTLGSGISYTLDATGEGPWCTCALWSSKGQFLWRVERMYSGFSLQSYPNPFRDRTAVTYMVPGKRVWGMSDDGREMITHYAGSDRVSVSLSVYDAAGRLVKVLTDEGKVPGQYGIDWDGTTYLGLPAASGSYFLRLAIDDGRVTKSSVTRKVVLAR